MDTPLLLMLVALSSTSSYLSGSPTAVCEPLRIEPHDYGLVVVLVVHAGQERVRGGPDVVRVVLVRQPRQQEGFLVLHLIGGRGDALFAPVY